MREHREELIKIIISGLMLAFFMVLTRMVVMPWYIELLLFAVPYLIIGGEVILEAGKNILHGEVFDECFLMSIATLGAFAIGEYPEAVFVMIFFAVGEFFEHLATAKSRRSIADLMNIRPDSANLETKNGVIEVTPETVKKGDVIVIKPGERIPLDGIVISGNSSVNTTALTGESLPVDVAPGDKVISGCINSNGLIRVEVTGSFAESTVAKILELVENSAQNKAKSEAFITRFSRVYTPAVVGLATLLAIIPSVITGQYGVWIYRALMFLVVSCPCALVVSVPLSYFSGIGTASKKGILIKGAGALEALAAVNTIVFDKTGTLTHGNFFVTAIHPQQMNEEQLLTIAAIAESFSDHPISISLKNACLAPIDQRRATEVQEISGHGVLAKVDGHSVCVGNDKLMLREGIAYRNCHRTGTIVHVAVDGIYGGHIVISDQIKEDSARAVANLKQIGVSSVMLTGDRTEVAEEVALSAGVGAFFAELLPADKVRIFEDLLSKQSKDKKIAFTGDGINDAPVLARADIGIAMGALGSDAAIEAADIVLMDDKLSKLPVAIGISQKTNRIVWQNIIFALAVKFGVLILSAFGWSDMWFAAFADAGVLVLAVLNATRLLFSGKLSN